MTTRLSVPLSHNGQVREVELVVDQGSGQGPDVLLMHGFARGPDALAQLAAALAAEGSWVVRPHIRSFGRRRGMTDPDFVEAVASAAISQLQRMREHRAASTVVVGHSAGGACAAHAAMRLRRAGVAVEGMVLIDPNESLTPMLVPGVDDVGGSDPRMVRVIAAEPGRCNRQGLGPRTIAARVPGFVGVRVVGGTHCEVEGTAADLVCLTVCGGASDPDRTALLHQLVVGWVGGLGGRDGRWLPGDRSFDDLVDAGRLDVLGGAFSGPTGDAAPQV